MLLKNILEIEGVHNNALFLEASNNALLDSNLSVPTVRPSISMKIQSMIHQWICNHTYINIASQ